MSALTNDRGGFVPRLRELFAARAATPPHAGIAIGIEPLILIFCLFWTLTANQAFLHAAMDQLRGSGWAAWGFAAALVVLVTALHALLVGLVAARWNLKPLLAVLTLVAAATAFFSTHYGVYFDASMLRNVLRTNPAEASELLSWRLALHLLVYAVLPLAVLWRLPLARRSWRRALLMRLILLVLALLALIGAILSSYQPLASMMRNHKELRYLVTPVSPLWSSGRALGREGPVILRPREPIGTDAAAGPSWRERNKPLVLVLVVGESARAANWGLNGYERQTTPRLAQLPVVNFSDVTSCGSNTEVSVPCMFAPVGRRQYDEKRIRREESLLHVLARIGVKVQWRDNQSGCKGVCDGLPYETVAALDPPGLCADGRCYDEGLIADIDQRLATASGTQVWVLHMLGNHGPAYYRRYPQAQRPFTPDCREDDLHLCNIVQIVNAYDNAIAYTDHVLATAIEKLQAHAEDVDSALLFVSDHGESLGERGLFLHGLPYAIAPVEQTRVPMIFWASRGFERGAGLRQDCLLPQLRAQAGKPLGHDQLFHTTLGLLDVRTGLHEPELDLVGACRATPAGA